MTETQTREKKKETVPSLMMDVIGDAEDLLTQQFTMFKYEIKDELRQAKAALLPLLVGIGFGVLGAVVFAFAIVHALHAATELSLWACYAIVAGAFGVIGAILFYWGKHEIDDATPIADDSMDALKENVKWLTKSK